MSLASWLDRAGSNERALTAIIEQKGSVYSQLRAERGYGSGMTVERGKALFHQYIEMRIDAADDYLTTRQYVGLTANLDIRRGDVIRVPRQNGGFDSLTVDTVRWMGSVARVELHYGS